MHWTIKNNLNGQLDINSNFIKISFMEHHKESTRIKVVVRKRPISKKEKSKNDADILVQRDSQTVVVKEMK